MAIDTGTLTTRITGAPESEVKAEMNTTAVALEAHGIQAVYLDSSRKSPSGVLAIENIDLIVRKGEFVTVVGPSGCGKSTFLKIVGGLMTATAGTMSVPSSGHGRTHATVFQDSALFPWYSVLRNVAFGLVCQGISPKKAEARAMPYIELVGLEGFENKYPHQLSGGMQQRANLARALAVDPDLLLMDEPFAALDAQTREVMQAELLRIVSETNKTVLFITHQIDEAVYLSDRVEVMSARPGRILEEVAIELPRPRSLEVKLTPEFTAYNERIWRLISKQLPERPGSAQ
jgi:NitT/TauT family transport system ATP-binding protein